MRSILTAALASLLAAACAGEPPPHTMTEVSGLEGPPGTSEQALVAARSVWEYDDTGTDLGTGWRETTPASDWSTGPGPLGYGESYVATVVSYGGDPGDKHPTTYFRRAFTVSDPGRVEKLYLRAMFDDGFVFYLNGREGGRAWMPSGTITFDTFALGHETGNNYMTFDVSDQIPNLVAGANTIAVEVHQHDAGSSDLTMDMELVAFVSGGGEVPEHEPTPRGIPAESTWLYWDQGGDLGTAWREPGYEPAGWKSGAAPLGFGESYIATETAQGPITTYFRHEFTSNGDATGLSLAPMYDDGYVAYLNGVEIHRAAMPDGPITADTRSTGHEARGYQRVMLSEYAHLIVEGVNVLAVEVHQVSSGSSDLVWDARLDEETAWQPQDSGTTADLFDVHAADTRRVWAVGAGGTIVRTLDGGATWAPQVSGTTSDLNAVWLQLDDFDVDIDRGTIVGDGGTILSTTDGEIWIDRSLAVPARLEDVSFVGERGWAVASGDVDSTTDDLYVTSDGGLTWTPMPTGISGGNWAAVLFIDHQRGWIAGTSFDHEGGVIYRTDDGGTSWTLAWAFDNHGYWPAALAQHAFDDIWMVGQSSFAGTGEVKLVARDGGTFEEAPRTGNNVGIYDLDFASSTHGVGVGVHGSIVVTEDGGESWIAARVPHYYVHAHLHGVDFSFFDRDTGWAVGVGGTILKTTSGGIDSGWVRHDPPEQNLDEVMFLDDRHGWLIGDQVWETEDGGESWTEVAGIEPAGAIEVFGDRHVWIAGRPEIWYSADGGDTWTTYVADLGGDHWIGDLSFVSPTVGWLTINPVLGSPPPEQPDLYMTTDGGATWDPVPIDFEQVKLGAVEFVDEDHGWVIGEVFDPDNGGTPPTILQTRDGGASWEYGWSYREEGDSYDGTLNGLDALDSETAWVVGSRTGVEGELVVSTHDGGDTYQLSLDPDGEPLLDVCFADAEHGWAVGSDQTILATRDGGTTWDVHRLRPGGWTLRDVHATSRYDAWVVGSVGDLFETSTGGY